MQLTFGFSPCPNDTFMFEPIVNKKIDLMGYDFNIIMEDVEWLNKAALNKETDITKLSFNAFTQVHDSYQLLRSGSALGNNCGPLLISNIEHNISDVKNLKIAIPGFNTTAFLLLKFAFPEVHIFEEMLFSNVEDAVISGQCDAGLIIHENRFTYHQKGLVKILDLGEFWEKETGAPIPLGGIAIKRGFDVKVKADINKIIFESVAYAFSHPDSGWDFIRCHAQEMSQDVMQSHIDLYVNDESRNISEKGRHAINQLFEILNIPIDTSKLFV